MLTLNQLKNFLLLAEILHFAKTAERLGITQAALSRDIKKLENEIACQLFDRSDKWNISLTASGRAYYERLKEFPGLLEQAKSEALKAARGETGTLRIMVHPSIYNQVDMSLVFQRMLTKWPEVKLKINDAVSDLAAEALHKGECDVAFYSTTYFPKSNNPHFITKEMFTTPFVLAFPANHRLAGKEKISVTDLSNCRFIMPPVEDAPEFRRHLEGILIKEGRFTPIVAQEARGPMATLNLVAASLGVGILPSTFRNVFPDRVVLQALPFKAERTVVAAWLDNNPAPALQNFLSVLNSISEKGRKEDVKKKAVRK